MIAACLLGCAAGPVGHVFLFDRNKCVHSIGALGEASSTVARARIECTSLSSQESQQEAAVLLVALYSRCTTGSHCSSRSSCGRRTCTSLRICRSNCSSCQSLAKAWRWWSSSRRCWCSPAIYPAMQKRKSIKEHYAKACKLRGRCGRCQVQQHGSSCFHFLDWAERAWTVLFVTAVGSEKAAGASASITRR